MRHNWKCAYCFLANSGFMALSLGEDAKKALCDAIGAPSVKNVAPLFRNSFNKITAGKAAIMSSL